jgi:hypothetical protein
MSHSPVGTAIRTRCRDGRMGPGRLRSRRLVVRSQARNRRWAVHLRWEAPHRQVTSPRQVVSRGQAVSLRQVICLQRAAPQTQAVPRRWVAYRRSVGRGRVGPLEVRRRARDRRRVLARERSWEDSRLRVRTARRPHALGCPHALVSRRSPSIRHVLNLCRGLALGLAMYLARRVFSRATPGSRATVRGRGRRLHLVVR